MSNEVLDNGVEETRAYFETHIDAEFVTPAPVYTEFLIGDVHGDCDTDLDVLAQNIEWVDVIEVNKRIARLAADVTDEIGEQGPELTSVDALVAATAREMGGQLSRVIPTTHMRRHGQWLMSTPTNVAEYTLSIVVQIISKFGDRFDNVSRNVPLHLYNPQTNDVYFGSPDFPSPIFYDQDHDVVSIGSHTPFS